MTPDPQVLRAEVVPVFGDEPEHEASPQCWCEPELNYVDPETGGEVWVHRRMQ